MSLIDYREVQRVHTGFGDARGIAVGPTGDLLVAGDTSIRTFGPDGQQKREIPLSGEPQCVCVAQDGTMYIGFRDTVMGRGPEGATTAHTHYWEH